MNFFDKLPTSKTGWELFAFHTEEEEEEEEEEKGKKSPRDAKRKRKPDSRRDLFVEEFGIKAHGGDPWGAIS